MQYHSPFHLIPHEVFKGGVPSQSALRKSKKRLLAEFELMQTTTIEINGKEIDKDKIIRLFEQLESDAQYQHHYTLYNAPLLLDFLERGTEDIFQYPDRLEVLFQDEDFVRFVRPYFLDRFNPALYLAVRAENELLVEQLCEVPLIIGEEDEPTAFQKTYRYFKGQIIAVGHMAAELKEKYIDDEDLLVLFSYERINLMNTLPDYFDGIRCQYALELEDLALNLHNSHRRSSLATFALDQALTLDIDEETKRRLHYLLDQIKVNAKPMEAKDFEDKEYDYFWIGFVLVKLILLLVMSLKS